MSTIDKMNIIPQGWVEKKLGNIGTTYSGLTGKTKDDFGEGNALYITFLNILNNPLVKQELFEKVKVSPSEKQNEVRAGDLFFNTSSETPEEVGICAMLNKSISNLYLNSFCFGYRLNDKNIEPLYLSYFFRSALGRDLMSSLAQGVTRYNVSKSAFNEKYILVPSLKEEQKRIAEVLSDMDALIDSLDKLIAKKQAIKQGTMQQLLTGKTRLAGFTEPWVEKRLGDICNLKNGYAFKSSDYCDSGVYRIITISNVQCGLFVADNCNTINDIPADIQKHQILSKDDLLISMTGNVGRVCMVKDSNCLLNQRVGKLEILPNINSIFLYIALQDIRFLNSMIESATGGAQPNIGKKDIDNYLIIIPSDPAEQQAIATILSDMDSEITALEAKKAKYEAIKQGAMQQLLTGRIRLI